MSETPPTGISSGTSSGLGKCTMAIRLRQANHAGEFTVVLEPVEQLRPLSSPEAPRPRREALRDRGRLRAGGAVQPASNPLKPALKNAKSLKRAAWLGLVRSRVARTRRPGRRRGRSQSLRPIRASFACCSDSQVAATSSALASAFCPASRRGIRVDLMKARDRALFLQRSQPNTWWTGIEFSEQLLQPVRMTWKFLATSHGTPPARAQSVQAAAARLKVAA